MSLTVQITRIIRLTILSVALASCGESSDEVESCDFLVAGFCGNFADDPVLPDPVVDLSVTIQEVSPPVVSTDATYSIFVTNRSSYRAYNVKVVHNLPSEVNFVSALPPTGWACDHVSGILTCTVGTLWGGTPPSSSFTQEIRIVVTLPKTPGIITSTTSISSTSNDSNLANNKYTSKVNVIPPTADLVITMATIIFGSSNVPTIANPPAVVLGEKFIYHISVTNEGIVDATDVVVNDMLPPEMEIVSDTYGLPENCNQGLLFVVTCKFGTVGVRGQASNTKGVLFEVRAMTEGTFDNTANVTSSIEDADPTSNSVTATISVGKAATVIQSQIDIAADGATVLVAPGNYVGSIDFLGKAITVASEQGPLVTFLTGSGSTSAIVSFVNGEGPGSILDGFTVQNGHTKGILAASSSPTIINNIVENNISEYNICGEIRAGIVLLGSSAIVKQNTIRDNNSVPYIHGSCGGYGGGGGIWVQSWASESVMIVDNFIVDNSSSHQAAGIFLYGAGRPTIRGNTISGNSGGAIGIRDYSDALILQNVISNNTDDECGGIDWLVTGFRGPYVINNTLVDNEGSLGSSICSRGLVAEARLVNNNIVGKQGQTAVYCDSRYGDLETPIIESNNIISSSGSAYGGLCNDQTGINGNISSDPLFFDLANEDYRLTTNSPAIDAGDNSVPGLPATDIIGEIRIVDGDLDGNAKVDLGAFEYIP
ncbi:MAG: putative repeat protein (TIGR01451 family) [Oceanicoccus sp.]|jgi:uncharacterized repeat protein (TIGR01451 family)